MPATPARHHPAIPSRRRERRRNPGTTSCRPAFEKSCASSKTSGSDDMLFDKGKLEKLTLRAFKPARPNEPPQPSDAPGDIYTVQVNPKSYTLNRLLNYSYHRG